MFIKNNIKQSHSGEKFHYNIKKPLVTKHHHEMNYDFLKGLFGTKMSGIK